MTRSLQSKRDNSRTGVRRRRRKSLADRRRFFRPGIEGLEPRLLLANGERDIISVGRFLSEWSVADVQNNELQLTYTVFNQQASTVEGVLLTTTLEPGVSLESASLLPDQNGQELAWSLGSLDPFGRASIDVTVSFDVGIPLQIDDGAEAFGSIGPSAVNDAANPATLRADSIDDSLLASTPDANAEDPFVRAKAAELNQEADEIFAFLTQDIGYESYTGSLRGSRGTLWSSAGNALDQSSLMIALLRASGVPAQYARGTLADADAQQLIGSMFPVVSEAVGTIPVGAEVSDPLNDPQLISETRNHFWVQLDTGSGLRDADPAFGDAAIGQAFTTADETFAAVPDALRHKTTLRLDRELANTAASALFNLNPLSTATVLEATFATAELVGKPLTIGHFFDRQTLGGTVFTSITNVYSPYLQVGDLARNSAEDEIILGTEYQELITDFPLSSEVLTGLFLEIELSGPDGPSETHRRTLLDLIGFDIRQTGGVPNLKFDPNGPPSLSPFDLWTVNVLSSLHALRPIDRLAADLRETFNELAELIANDVESPQAAILQNLLVQQSRSYAASLLAMSDTYAQGLADASLVKAYYDRPRVVILSATTGPGDTAAARLEFASDLRRDSIRGVAFPGQVISAAAPFQAARSLLNNVIEATVFPDAADVNDVQLQTRVSTSTIFAAARDQGISLVDLSPNELVQLDALQLSTQAKARITDALLSGLHVLVPERNVTIDGEERIAWYEINVETGELRGVDENGNHFGIAGWATVLFFVATELAFLGYEIHELIGPSGGDAVFSALRPTYDACLATVRLNKDDPANAADQFFEDRKKRKQVCLARLTEDIESSIQDAEDLKRVPFLFEGFASRLRERLNKFKEFRTDPAVPNEYQADSGPIFFPNLAIGGTDVMANRSAGAVAGTAEVSNAHLTQLDSASWTLVGDSALMIHSLTAATANIFDDGGGLIGTGVVSLDSTLPVAALVSGDVDVAVRGTGAAAVYSDATTGLGVSTQWDVFTADLTGTVGIALTTDALVLDGSLLPPGSYTLATSAANVGGADASLAPTYASDVALGIDNGSVLLAAGTGSLDIAGDPIDLSQSLTLVGYTGTVGITADTGSDTIELNGAAIDRLQIAATPDQFNTDQNTPITFALSIETSLSDEYNIGATAPGGWQVTLDDDANFTVVPAPGVQSGTFAIEVAASSLSTPELIARDQVLVTINATQPGVDLTVAADDTFFVPVSGGQLPSAFRAGVQNLGPASDDFALTFPVVPAGFDIQSSFDEVTIGAGQTGGAGVYLIPNSPLPPPGTDASFSVTATSLTDGSITDTEFVPFILPDVHGLRLRTDPGAVNTVPGVGVDIDLLVESVGNVAEDVKFDVELPAGLSLSGLADLSLAAGGSQTLTLTLTPDAATPLNSFLLVTITADFNGREPVEIGIPLRVVAPGAVAAADAAEAAEQLGNQPLAENLDNLSTALTGIVENPGDPIFKQQAAAHLAAIAAIIGAEPELNAIVDSFIIEDLGFQLLDAETDTECSQALDDIDAALQDLAAGLAALARNNFTLALFPNSHIAQPQVPQDFQLRIQNIGLETTTYDVSVAGVPATVTSQLSQTQVTVDPGEVAEVILTLTQTTPDELLTFGFQFDVTTNGVTPAITKSAAGSLLTRREVVSVTNVNADPPFVDPGEIVNVSASLISGVNKTQDANVAFEVFDPNGLSVFTSTPVPAQLTLQTKLTDVDLGPLDTTGFALGQYAIEVTVLDEFFEPIPNAITQGILLVGSPVEAMLTIDPQLSQPGDVAVSNTLQIDAAAQIGDPLSIVAQVPLSAFTNDVLNHLAVNDDVLYVFGNNRGVHAIDITEPRLPQYLEDEGRSAANGIVDGDRLITIHGGPPNSITFGANSIIGYYDLGGLTGATPSNLNFPIGELFPNYQFANDLVLRGDDLFVSTLQVRFTGAQNDIFEQNGTLLSIDLSNPFSLQLSDVLFNELGGNATPPFNANGGPFNMFGLAHPEPNTLLVGSTTATGTDTQTGVGRILVVDITDADEINSDPPNTSKVVNELQIPGTVQARGITLDGNIAYVVASQGGWLDNFADVSDIGPTGDIVLASVDVSDPRNPILLHSEPISRAARGSGELVKIGDNRFAMFSLGTTADTPQVLIIDTSGATAATNPSFTVEASIDLPGMVRGLTTDGEFLYVSGDFGLLVYQIEGGDAIPVTASVQIPNNTGVAVVPGSFNIAPDTITPGLDFDTLQWSFTLDETNLFPQFTWNTEVTDLQPGESRDVTLDTTIDFTFQATADQITLPPESVAGRQLVIDIDPHPKTTRPGEPVFYSIRFANLFDDPDDPFDNPPDVTYDISLQGLPADWFESPFPATVTIPNATNSVFVNVTPDPLAPLGDYEFVVTASHAGENIFGSAQGTLTLAGDPFYQDGVAQGVFVELDPPQQSVGLGGSTTFALTLTNTGSQTDTFRLFDFDLGGFPEFTTAFSPDSIVVAPGVSNARQVTFSVSVAPTATPGDYFFDPSVQSANIFGGLLEPGVLTVLDAGVDVELTPSTGSPESTFDLMVTNIGPTTDTFDLSIAAPAALVATLGTSQVTLDAGETQSFPIDVGAIDFALPGSVPLVAAAQSQTVPAVQDAASADVEIFGQSGVAAEFDPDTVRLTIAGAATLLLRVENLANVSEDYTATIIGTTGPIASASLVGPDGQPTPTIDLVTLPALSNGLIEVEVVLTDEQTGTVTVEITSLSASTIQTAATGTIEFVDELLDFGDAPEDITVDGVLREYPTFLDSDGARHAIVDGGPFLGALGPDPEADGQANADANGDDNDASGDDEDVNGSDPIVLTAGQPLTGLEISYDGGAAGAFLSGWIDLNIDGDWEDDGEQFLVDVAVPGGASSISLDNLSLPADAIPGTSFVRLRISTESGLAPTGLATDGEVEDFQVEIIPAASESIHGRKWNDLNQDGARDAGEPWLNGWTIILCDTEGNHLAEQQTHDIDLNGDNVIDPETERGWYWFQNLAAGTYVIAEEDRTGWEQSQPTDAIKASVPGVADFGYLVELGLDDATDTASFNVQASAELSVLQINEPGGSPLTELPAGFQAIPSVNGVPTTLELSGTGILNFMGTFTSSGTGLASVVNLASDVSGSAVPVGVADGFETAVGGIRFINNADIAIEVTVQFDSLITAMASATNPILESVTDLFYDVEFSETLGGDPNSPCTGGILEDLQAFGLSAPLDTAVESLGAPISRSMTIPAGSTCSYNVLVQAGARAEAKEDAPTYDFGNFQIQPQADLDFGDAPEDVTVDGVPRVYPTSLDSDGARHAIVEGGPILGSVGPDADVDGQPNADATGDDAFGSDDEDADGTNAIILTRGRPLTEFSIDHDGGQAGAFLNGWIDLNRDGDWDDDDEQFLLDVAVPAGASSTSLGGITLPASASLGTSFVRLRISTQDGLTPRGAASDGEVEDFAVTIRAPQADLSLDKSVDNAMPNVGQPVTFTIVVTNAGDGDATGVEVTDLLPAGLMFVEETVTQGSYDSQSGVWFVGMLPVDGSATLSITATVTTADPHTNTAEVTASDLLDPDSTPGNNVESEDDQDSVVVTPQVADLSLLKTVDNRQADFGEEVTFTITLANDGPDAATGVEVTDLLPAGMTFIEASAEQGDYDEASGLWNVGSLAAEATTTLTITATINSENPLTNTAEVTAADQFDPDSTPGNHISTEDDQFSAGVGLCLTGGPLVVGTNRLIYSCATPGSLSAFVMGTEPGSFFFDLYDVAVEVADPEVLALSIANIDGIAVILFDLTEEQVNQSFTFQAFEMKPNLQLSNTLTLQASETPLLATEVGLGAAPLDANVLPGLLDAAIARWEATGLSPHELDALESITLSVDDLPDGFVGATIGNKVLLDLDAAGNGWFVDATPWDDAEFTLHPDDRQMRAVESEASGQVDALTVVLHELGHLLGLPDLPAGMGGTHLMQHKLEPGLRRLPISHTNWRLSEDVSGDGVVSPVDALLVINVLNGAHTWSVDSPAEIKLASGEVIAAFLDTDGDYFVAPNDALRVINYLNRSTASEGEGEASSNAAGGDPTVTSLPLVAEAVFALDHQQWRDPATVAREATSDKILATERIEPGRTSAEIPTSKSHHPLAMQPQVLEHLPEVELLIDELANDVLLGWNSFAT